MRADLGGTLNEPGLKLDAVLNGAAYEDLVLGVLLTDINAKAAMSPGGDIALDLRAGDGLGGSLALTGALRTDGMRFELNGSMDNLRPLRRQDLRVSLSGTAQGSGTVSAPDLKADIRVNEGSLQLAHLPGSGLRTLDIAQDGEEAAPRPSDAPSTQSAQSGERQDTEQAGGSLDLTLSVPTRFFVRGYGLDSEWRGRVSARGPLARPELVGRLEAVRGAMDFLNRNFSLNHGAVILDGGWPANPRLDIVLDYQAANIVAGIQVNGTARQPKLELVSEPHLPQDEILSQILFGKSVSAIGKLEALQLASAVAGLAGGGGGGGLLGLGRQALGVDVLRLNTGNGGEGDEDMQSSSLEMGKYIHDRVYVGVQQGMGPESSGGVVEIELTPRIHFKAGTRGGDSEAGLRWQRNY